MTYAPAVSSPTASTAPPVPAAPPGPGSAEGPRRAAPGSNRFTRIFLGRTEDPRWARPGLWGLMVATALLYLVNLTNSGYANEFYAASVKSATQSWRAWLWASLDSQLSITVDKPPAAIWVMGASARIFGFSSFSLLLPQALMGIATVALTYGTVRRLSGHGAGLLAGAVVTVTPVAAMMFRFDNPDAMLVLCTTAAGYMIVRALQSDRGRRALWWMLGAGWLIGLAFLTKMLQGLLVLPALALVYLLCARRSWWTRIWHLLAAMVSMIVSAGWLIALCAVWPASSRPYIGGSTNNSLWELAMGYNGLGRIFSGAGNGGGGGGSFGGSTGLLRMFNSSFAAEISWLLPATALLLVAGLISCGRRPLADRSRAGLILWGGSLLTTTAVFSFMEGTIHPYYTVALAPLIGGTIASGAAEIWPRGSDGRTAALLKRITLAVAFAFTGFWGFHLMATYAPSWNAWIRWTALVVSIAGAVGHLVLGGLRSGGQGLRKVAVAALLAGTIAAAAPSASWTVATAAVGHSGSTPFSGPASATSGGMGGGGMGGGQGGGGQTGPGGQTGTANSRTGGKAQTGPGGQAGGASGGQGSTTSRRGQRPSGTSQPGQSQSGQTPGSGVMSGESNAQLVKLLNATSSKWSAAAVSDQAAAGYILSTDTAVFSIGGWSGSDENVTLAQFKKLVASGQIRYFIVSGMGGGGGTGGPGGSSGSASQITSWVTSTFKKMTVGSTTVYDLSTTAS
ncbi:ArnT family glycosyltransferase [Acidipropionibacterium virtanenii]|uniref:Undecaprenyl phosphate-alpha-4-amino-4-deoxy-L-arabinose arabinosyl transferase n=1 Tax=Acidipropionibacterium virtanenii TaxID=2057246 RepID=A0A344UPW5_9ACTN|nr:glycosyltransferase family 39 protein [Acidipropionibacterium virtanenii]AXE37313.1 Undecaprenyl phosphate-alpha-4-amino-4-deoxy-L-arabinose arabinosyl transferase [Acidipropionibacterium virtanenii]